METQEMLKSGNCYLSFIVANEFFATHVAHVKKIIEVIKITYLPNTSVFIRGIISFEGQAIPVIDARILFKLSPIEIDNKTCILIMDIKNQETMIRIGVLVESVHKVFEINEKEILPTPRLGGFERIKEFIYGLINSEDETIMLMDFDKLFDSNYMKQLNAMSASLNKE